MKALDFILFPILLALMIMAHSARSDSVYIKPMYVKTVDGSYINIQWVSRIRVARDEVCVVRSGYSKLTKKSMNKLIKYIEEREIK